MKFTGFSPRVSKLRIRRRCGSATALKTSAVVANRATSLIYAYMRICQPQKINALRSDDHLEVRTLHSTQFLVQHGNTFVRRNGYRPFDAIVRDEHAVTLQRHQNRPGFRRKPGDVEVLTQAQSFAHAWEVLIR